MIIIQFQEKRKKKKKSEYFKFQSFIHIKKEFQLP